jgi:hypothetical protein
MLNRRKLTELHAAVFNFGARITGVALIVVGSVFSFWALRLVLDAESTMMVNGVPENDPVMKWVLLLLFLLLTVLGVFLLFARPYRPWSDPISEVKDDKKA